MKLKWSHWFYTLGKTVIGGVASSGAAWLGTLVGNQLDKGIAPMNLKEFGIVLLTSTAMHLFFFLKQSPLPEDEESKNEN